MVRSSNNKPPGASSFNIEPAIEEVYSDGVEVLDSLPVGAVMIELNNQLPELGDQDPGLTSPDPDDWDEEFFWPLSEWREHYPYWGQPGILARLMMGDGFAMTVNAVLTLGQHILEMSTVLMPTNYGQKYDSL